MVLHARQPLARRILVPALVTGLLAGGSGGCAGAVAPRRWASAVCTALRPWRAEIASLTARTQEQMTAATTPAQTKQNLVALLAGVQDASETAWAKVAAAGTPDVDNGARIAARFVASLRAARDAYAHARTAVEGLDTTDPAAFYAAVVAAFGRLSEEYAQSSLDTTDLGSAPLQRAFAEAPDCQ
jgi:predicted lipid-binding transport protein (Tim44 family)